jgi:DMSO reductase anchor subunit
MLGFRATLERFQMYLTTLDLLAVMIALVVSVTLVITSAVANARLQRKIDQLRTQRWEITKEYESIISDLEQK